MSAGIPVKQTNVVGYSAQVGVTRPANQTPYTALDVVGGVIEFPNMGPAGGQIKITSVDLRIDVAAVPAGMTTFRLHLYNVTPPSAIADNAAWDLPAGDRAAYLGYVDILTPVDVGSTLSIQTDALNRQVKLAGTSLFAYLVTTGGFTPAANSEVYNPRLYSVAQ
jgi:hypothetical protein